MTTQAKQLQDQLDPTTPMIAQDNYPIGLVFKSKTPARTIIVLSEKKEIEITEWKMSRASGLEKLESGEAVEVPLHDLIAELESIIAELKSK